MLRWGKADSLEGRDRVWSRELPSSCVSEEGEVQKSRGYLLKNPRRVGSMCR